MTPKELCQLQHIQLCHICNDYGCGDNTNPLRKLEMAFRQLKQLMEDSSVVGLQRYCEIENMTNHLLKVIEEVLGNGK